MGRWRKRTKRTNDKQRDLRRSIWKGVERGVKRERVDAENNTEGEVLETETPDTAEDTQQEQIQK